MRSNNTYILQLFVKKCKINVQQSGSVSLLLRAGKNQSHVTNPQPIINGTVNFNTQIKLNIDDSALDTQRCTLTLNFTSKQNVKRVIGIVVITLPDIGTEIEKKFKVTSTPDKEADIEVAIGLKEVEESRPVQQELREAKSVSIKQSDITKSLAPTKKNGIFGSMMMSINSKTEETPTSPPSETTEKLNLKSRRSQIDSIGGVLQQSEDMQTTIERLEREKQCLKALLKLEMGKSSMAMTHLKSIIEMLQTAVGVNPLNTENLRQTTVAGNFGVGKIPSVDSLDLSCKGSLSISSPGQIGFGLSVVKESRFEDFSPGADSRLKGKGSKLKSDISTISRSLGVSEVLTSLRSRIDQVGKQKTELNQIFNKIKMQPKIQLDATKLRVLKTRIDKIYIPLLMKQSITKAEIMKQKIEINKILDEVVYPFVK